MLKHEMTCLTTPWVAQAKETSTVGAKFPYQNLRLISCNSFFLSVGCFAHCIRSGWELMQEKKNMNLNYNADWLVCLFVSYWCVGISPNCGNSAFSAFKKYLNFEIHEQLFWDVLQRESNALSMHFLSKIEKYFISLFVLYLLNMKTFHFN